jgi:cysteinyl-tRNA synthetase
MDGLSSSHKARVRIQDYIYSLFDESTTGNAVDINILELEKKVSEDLASDLHTPKALGAVFTFINHHPPENLTAKAKGELKSFFKFINSIFHVWSIDKRPDIIIEIPQEVVDLAEARVLAKKNKDYTEADSLRLKIQDLGYLIKDSKEGYTLGKI